MKLVQANYNVIFDFEKFHIYEWIIENPVEYRKIVFSMRNPESDFILSHRDKILKWEKETTIIENPLRIQLDEKRIINKMYAEIKEIAESEDEYMKTQNFLSMLKSFFLHLEEKINFDISVSDEVDFLQLEKAMGIRIDASQESYLEVVCEYCRILFEILNIQLLVFLNLRTFLSDEELKLLVEMSLAREWNLLLLENSEHCILKNVSRVILDEDLCEIF